MIGKKEGRKECFVKELFFTRENQLILQFDIMQVASVNRIPKPKPKIVKIETESNGDKGNSRNSSTGEASENEGESHDEDKKEDTGSESHDEL